MMGEQLFATGALLAAGGYLTAVSAVGLRLARTGSLADQFECDDELMKQQLKKLLLLGIGFAGAGVLQLGLR